MVTLLFELCPQLCFRLRHCIRHYIFLEVRPFLGMLDPAFFIFYEIEFFTGLN